MSSSPYPMTKPVPETYVHLTGSAICNFEIALQRASERVISDPSWRAYQQHWDTLKDQSSRFSHWVEIRGVLTGEIDSIFDCRRKEIRVKLGDICRFLDNVINMLQQEKPVMSDVMLDYLVSLNKLLDWLEGKILGWEETWDLRAKSCRIMAMLARNLKEAKKSEDQMCARFLVHHFLQWCFNTNLYKHGTDSIVSRVRRDDELNGQDKLEQSLSDCLQRLMESLTDMLNGIGKDGPGSSEPTNEKDGKRPEMSVMKWRTAESYTCIKQLEELSERLSTLPD